MPTRGSRHVVAIGESASLTECRRSVGRCCSSLERKVSGTRTQGPPLPSLFHTVPNRMVGTVLYPLNELEDIDPETWRQEREGADGS